MVMGHKLIKIESVHTETWECRGYETMTVIFSRKLYQHNMNMALSRCNYLYPMNELVCCTGNAYLTLTIFDVIFT